MSTAKKKAAGLDALKNLQPPAEAKTSTKSNAKKKTTTRKKPASPSPAPAPVQEKAAKAPSPTPIKSFNLNLPLEAHEKLREIAFHEKDSMTSLILDGIDMLFAARGLPPLAQKKG